MQSRRWTSSQSVRWTSTPLVSPAGGDGGERAGMRSTLAGVMLTLASGSTPDQRVGFPTEVVRAQRPGSGVRSRALFHKAILRARLLTRAMAMMANSPILVDIHRATSTPLVVRGQSHAKPRVKPLVRCPSYMLSRN